MVKNNSLEGVWCRHPLAYLVEAADDICYLIVDIEDAFKHKMITFEKTENFLKDIAVVGGITRYVKVPGQDDKIAYLRAKAIGVLVGQVSKAFWENDEEILRGQFKNNLLNTIPSSGTLNEIRQFCKERIFSDERKLEAEVAGFEVIRGLLDFYTETLQEWEKAERDLSKMSPRHQTAIQLLPDYKFLPATKYQWLLRVTDYISGMTDRFAVKQYRNLKGIRIGGDRI